MAATSKKHRTFTRFWMSGLTMDDITDTSLLISPLARELSPWTSPLTAGTQQADTRANTAKMIGHRM